MKKPDDFEQDCRKIIETYGHMVQQVGGSGWAYTIGLTSTLGYELICVGLPPQVAEPVLNDLAAMLKGAEIPDEQAIAEISNMPVILRTIDLAETPDVGILIGIARRLNIVPTKLRQMLWPDPAGNYPGSPDYNIPIPQDLHAIAAQEIKDRRVMSRSSKRIH